MPESLLVVDGVSRCFSRGGECVIALNDVSFEARGGEVVKLVGGSLDGKTTLLEIVAGLERPDEGSVRLAGRDLRTIPDGRRSRMGGKDIVWLNRRGPSSRFLIADWVGLPLAVPRKRRAAERRATQILERVGMREYGPRTWAELSHRQQVLVAFAKAFGGSPRLVVIDDLMGGLETGAGEEAIDLLHALMKESERACVVLFSVSEGDSTGLVDRVLSIYKGSVQAMTGLAENDADILPFPGADRQQNTGA